MFVCIETVTNDSECTFYHSFDFPDGTSVDGRWDLRNRFEDYTGEVSFNDKNVLDVGTASGFLAFEAEKRGASVIGVDMGITDEWDVVPYAKNPIENLDLEKKMIQQAGDVTKNQRISSIKSVRNSFYYAHRKFNSSVKLYQTKVYDLSLDVGFIDISIIGSILLHLRDPFLALQKVAGVTKEKIIVSDLVPSHYSKPSYFTKSFKKNACLQFLPNERFTNPWAWWGLTPDIVEKMLFVLGFEVEKISINSFLQWQRGPVKVWTLVARRVRI